MRITINGEMKEMEVETITDIIRHYDLTNRLVIVEVDGNIIEKADWDTTMVAPNMKVELVHFVGGG